MTAGASTKHTAFPEWLTREDIPDAKSWTVEEGEAMRGKAWTDIDKARMRVPHGADEVSRAIRAHEMVHAKVSPINGLDAKYANDIGVSPMSLIAAEEFRVNGLATAAGFNMDDLRDGSEVLSGEIAARNKDWNGAVHAVTATAGTKACNDYIRGVAKHDKDMAALLRKVHSELKKMWKRDLKRGTHRIGDTEIHTDTGMPYGFNKFTRKYAEYVERLLIRDDETGDGDGDSDELPSEDQIKQKTESGQFARLIELKLPKPNKVDGRIGRKRVATDIGRNPRRINRLLTDPDQRIFDRRTRGKGGVVLIDQSGSMSLTDRDISNIIEKAPGCVIIGYSHRPGSTDIPNIWVIADRGQVADSIPHSNGGNGVDAPAIEFAAKRLRTGEPFIWVCDGVVTDGKRDMMSTNLSEQCVRLVYKHRIHMVEDVDDALLALSRAATGERPATQLVGRLKVTARVSGLEVSDDD